MAPTAKTSFKDTVELHWLELEGTVKIVQGIGSLSHRGPVI
jgi:hypothetical protein